MKSTTNKIPLGQIERGEELEKINEKANDSEVVHIEGDETIIGKKDFKENPKSDKPATSKKGLVRKEEFDEAVGSKAEDDSVVHKSGNKKETIDGEKTFEEPPKSDKPAADDKDLVRKKEFDAKADSDSISNKEIAIKLGDVLIGSFTLNQDSNEEIDLRNYIPEIADTLSSTSSDKALSAKKGKELKDLIEALENAVSSGLDLIGEFDPGTETEFPGGEETTKGDTWVVENSGTIDGEKLEGGDMIIARKNNPSKTDKDDWIFVQRNIDRATESKSGYIQIATQQEVDAGNDDEKAVTPEKLKNTLGDLAKKDKINTSDVEDGAITDDKLKEKYEKSEDGKSLIDDDLIEKIEQLDPDVSKNVQSDFLELDVDSDAFVKNKSSSHTVIDRFKWYEGDADQIFKTEFEILKILNVYVNGQRITIEQFDERGDGVEILDELTGLPDGQPETIAIEYDTPVVWGNLHGFKFDTTVSAPEVQLVGNPDLNSRLPIQSRMKGVVLQDDGREAYALDPDDWSKKEDETASDLTGADGQVMVRIPRHWILDRQVGDHRMVILSETPFDGAMEIPRFYVGAYKAALDRSEEKLSSVRNNTTNFRGGNNQSAWDSENQFKSQIGKPATNESRINFREYAQNRGANWYDVDYWTRYVIGWFITHEYANRDHQAAISAGPTTLSSEEWGDFNDRYPLFQCGITNEMGDQTGSKSVTLQDYPSQGQNEEIEVFRYRGIENWWGDIYEWTNGVNIIDNVFYINPFNRKKISNTNVDGYIKVGVRPTENGYIQQMYPGTILPMALGGSSSTYYGDYFYANDSEGLRGLRFGGSAATGARAGSFLSSSDRAPSSTLAYRGSRLCFFER